MHTKKNILKVERHWWAWKTLLLHTKFGSQLYLKCWNTWDKVGCQMEKINMSICGPFIIHLRQPLDIGFSLIAVKKVWPSRGCLVLFLPTRFFVNTIKRRRMQRGTNRKGKFIIFWDSNGIIGTITGQYCIVLNIGKIRFKINGKKAFWRCKKVLFHDDNAHQTPNSKLLRPNGMNWTTNSCQTNSVPFHKIKTWLNISIFRMDFAQFLHRKKVVR